MPRSTNTKIDEPIPERESVPLFSEICSDRRLVRPFAASCEIEYRLVDRLDTADHPHLV